MSVFEQDQGCIVVVEKDEPKHISRYKVKNQKDLCNACINCSLGGLYIPIFVHLFNCAKIIHFFVLFVHLFNKYYLCMGVFLQIC